MHCGPLTVASVLLQYDPFNGMIGRSAPLRPAMQPYMDIIETGPPIDLPMFDTGMPPMGGTGY
eukprot:903592-Rhodomonas_salina.1